jgi:hypothetical protein
MTDVLTLDELVGLLDRFGMKVKVDLAEAVADGQTPEYVTARLSHALVGVMAHATRAEEAVRRAGCGPEELAEVALMGFAGGRVSA